MRQILEHLGLLGRLTGVGPQRRGPCPIHSPTARRGRTFSVNLTQNIFQCFDAHCAAHGNALDLWTAVHQLPLRQAAEHLAHTFGYDRASNREEETVVPVHAPDPIGDPQP